MKFTDFLKVFSCLGFSDPVWLFGPKDLEHGCVLRWRYSLYLAVPPMVVPEAA